VRPTAPKPRPRLPYAWGATPAELAAGYACDERVSDPDETMIRAVDVRASAATTFRWLCQLRLAPYSYDWIDNWGRRSPRQLTPGVDRLRAGQKFMTIFELADFEPGREITVDMKRATSVFGNVSVTYRVSAVAEDQSRLVAKLVVRYPRRRPWSWMRALLPWGDLVMMRKQLLTLSASAAVPREP
jgi:hypothetical protein